MNTQIEEIRNWALQEGPANPLAAKIIQATEAASDSVLMNCYTKQVQLLLDGLTERNDAFEVAQFFAEGIYNIIGQKESMIFISECFNNNDELIHIAQAGDPTMLQLIADLKRKGLMPDKVHIPEQARTAMFGKHLIHFPDLQTMTMGQLDPDIIDLIEKNAGSFSYYGFPVLNGNTVLLTVSFILKNELHPIEFEALQQIMSMVSNFLVLLIQRHQNNQLNIQFQEVFDLGEYAFALYAADGSLIKGNKVFNNLFSSKMSQNLFNETFLQKLGLQHHESLSKGEIISFSLSEKVFSNAQEFGVGRITPVKRAVNSIAYYDFFIQSASDEQRLREAVQLKDEKYQRVFNHIQDVYFEVNKEGIILELSPSILKYLGRPREEFIGLNILTLYRDPSQRSEYLQLLEKNGQVENYHVDFIRPDGNGVIHAIVVASLVDRGTPDERIIGSMIDVTEQVHQHELIKESENKFRSLFDKSPLGILICDSKGQIIEVNKAMLKSLGSPSVEKTKQINVFTFENLVNSGISNAMQSVFKTEKSVVFETEYTSLWGQKRFYRLFVNLIPDALGHPQYVMLMAEDMTELRDREKELQQTEERFRDIYNNTSDLIYTMDFEGNFTSVNPVAEKWLGYRFSDLNNRNMSQFVSHDSVKRAAENIRLKLLGGTNQTTYEVTAFTRGGEKMILEINSFLRYKDGKPIEVFGIARDITERKKHEEYIQTTLRERESLIMEVHHRVKNNLQLILSMIKMYHRTFSDERVVQAFRDIMQKILAISAVHEDFYFSNNMKGINFLKYINTVVANSVEQFDMRNNAEYHVDAEQISCTIDEAVPVGLILAELVSNSLRYARVPGKRTSIHVSMHRKGDKTELICADNGPGIPSEVLSEPAAFLGLDLVRLLAENQLGGTMELQSDTSGTKITVVF